jgi:hypothetical protein
VVREGSGFIALTGPGLTEDVDEARLTTDALWEAVTDEPGGQDWFEPVGPRDRPQRAGRDGTQGRQSAHLRRQARAKRGGKG